MGNIIQIKRGSGQPGTGVLADGELGYDTTNGFLYIGVGNTSVKIKAEGSGGSSGTISGILSLAQGGTGADLSEAGTNAIIVKGSDKLEARFPTTGTGGGGAVYYTESGTLGFGLLPLSKGGVGADLRDATADAIVVKGSGNTLSTKGPTNGAVYYTESGTLSFGTLPISKGGTGTTFSGTATNSIIIKGSSALSSITPSSGAFYYDGSSLNFGTLPLGHGGTGSTTGLASAKKNAVIIKHATDSALSSVRSANGAFYSTGQDAAPVFGILPASIGGTGADLSGATTNSIIIKGSSGLEAKTASNGAVYYDTNNALHFGTLPISKGGTGATTAASALSNLGLVTPSVSKKITSSTYMTLTSTNRFIVLTVASDTRTAPAVILEASSITTTEKTVTVSFDSTPLDYQLGITRQSTNSNNYDIRAITRDCTVHAYGIL